MSFAKLALENGGSIKPLLISPQDLSGPSLTNPSVLVVDEKILVNIRNVNYTLYHSELNRFEHMWGPLTYVHPENDLHLRTVNYIAELDDNLDMIFYSKIDTIGGWNFLEAAPNDVIGTYQWATVNTSIPTSNSLGAGKSNTLTIIQQLGPSNPYYAALAAYYFPSGLNGWCLPSRDELMKMRENLHLSQLGNFALEETYWSSSQDSNFSGNAWTVKMTNSVSNTASYAKTSLYRIRPIRRY